MTPGMCSVKQPKLEGDQHILDCGAGSSFSEEQSPCEFFFPAETLVGSYLSHP